MAPASSPAQLTQELLAIIDGSAQRALEFARTCPIGGTAQMMAVFLTKDGRICLAVPARGSPRKLVETTGDAGASLKA